MITLLTLIARGGAYIQYRSAQTLDTLVNMDIHNFFIRLFV